MWIGRREEKVRNVTWWQFRLSGVIIFVFSVAIYEVGFRFASVGPLLVLLYTIPSLSVPSVNPKPKHSLV